MEAKGSVATAGALMDEWEKTLTNRDAHGDRGRLKKHVRPAFANVPMSRLVEIGPIMSWLDKQRVAGELADGSIRHNLNLLSRFFSWAVERGHAKVNPVRQIPQGRRPKQAVKREQPWLRDDGKVVELMRALAEPVNLMFYLGNRSGLRTGEICGLRMSDLMFLGEGAIRACKSYGGPLKEDKDGDGKVKWVPAPADWETFLGIWIKRRKLQGGEGGGPGLPGPAERQAPAGMARLHQGGGGGALGGGRGEACSVKVTWYQATRHSFVSRNLEAGASLDEVSAAVGHSSPLVTKRYYDHFLRKTFSARLTAGLTTKA